jgi:hypothetical protein
LRPYLRLLRRAAAFLTKNVALEDVTIKFEIWDTAGQGELLRARALESFSGCWFLLHARSRTCLLSTCLSCPQSATEV